MFNYSPFFNYNSLILKITNLIFNSKPKITQQFWVYHQLLVFQSTDPDITSRRRNSQNKIQQLGSHIEEHDSNKKEQSQLTLSAEQI